MNRLAAVELLCAGLREPGDQRRWLEAPGIDWLQLSLLASHHLVSPALYGSLRRANALTPLPREFAAALAELAALNRRRNERILAQLDTVAAILARAGITPTLLKGTATLLTDPRALDERIVGDIDLLVPGDRVEDAKATLLAAGFVRHRPVTLKLRLHYRVMHDTEPLLRSDHVTHVEIHRRFLYSKTASTMLDSQFQPQRLATAGGHEVLVAQPRVRWLHNALHHQVQNRHWRYATLDLRQLHEGYRLAADLEWDALWRLVASTRFARPVSGYVAALNGLFGTDHPIPAAHRGAAQRWMARVRRRYASLAYARADFVVRRLLAFPAAATWRVRHWLRMLAAARG